MEKSKKINPRKIGKETRKKIGKLLQTTPPSLFKSKLKDFNKRLKYTIKYKNDAETLVIVQEYLTLMSDIAYQYKKRLERDKLENEFGYPLFSMNKPAHGYDNYGLTTME